MLNYSKMSEDEKRWQRRDDAHTLARAEQIKADKIDEEFLKSIMKLDKIFPDIDYMIYY